MSHFSLPPGAARCPGPSTADVIASDNDSAPKHLLQTSYAFLGDSSLAFSRYTDEAFFQQEVDKLWPKVWQWACREEHIPDAGDYYVYDIGDKSVIVLRQENREIAVYYNACLHRGVQLKASASQGCSPEIRCPFHGFSWDLQGQLKDVPCAWDFPHIDAKTFSLPRIKHGLWGGFVFINFDNNCEPLDEYLGVLPQHFSAWPLDQRHIAIHIQKHLPANWKASQEAFIEAFHVKETHPQALVVAGDANTQYDYYGDNVSRFVQTLAYASPHLDPRPSEQEVCDAMGGVEFGLKVAPGQTAREVFAEHLRTTMGDDLQIDLSAYSNTEMLDSIEYFLFPNMFLFPGISLPMIYRFRPYGNDVDSCIFEVLYLRPNTPGQSYTCAPEPIQLGLTDSFTKVPELGGLGAVFDQDTAILEMQRKGFKASKAGCATLGNYQEVRIRHMHKTLDKYLAVES